MVNCGWWWIVGDGEVWVMVKCGWWWSVGDGEVWVMVKCGWWWSVSDGEVWVMVKCEWWCFLGDREVWVMVKTWGTRPSTEIEQGFFSSFPSMQSGMFVILCNTIFNYCNLHIYMYIFKCVPYIQMFLVWPFMPTNRNINHLVWLILYSKPLDLKCMKWIKSTLCSVCCIKICLFFYTTQLWTQNTGQSCSIEDAGTLQKVSMQKSLFRDRLHYAWKERTEQRGSAMWLRLGQWMKQRGRGLQTGSWQSWPTSKSVEK